MAALQTRLRLLRLRWDNRNLRAQRGFSLLEILVVLVIIGILISYVGPKVLGRASQARQQKVFADFRTIETALKIYRLDNYSYPNNAQGLEALVRQPDSGAGNWKTDGYIDRLPKDPWGNPYNYQQPGQHGAIDLSTLGADALVGGSGENQDLGNWEAP